jgi:hypothetical protein
VGSNPTSRTKKDQPCSISLLLSFLSPALAHLDSAKVIRNFFKTLFLSGLDSGLVFRELGHYRRVCDFSMCAYSVATSVKSRALEDRLPRIGIGADCSPISPCSAQNRRLLRLVRWLLFRGWLSEEDVARRRFFLGTLPEDLLFQDYEFPLHRFLGHAP